MSARCSHLGVGGVVPMAAGTGYSWPASVVCHFWTNQLWAMNQTSPITRPQIIHTLLAGCSYRVFRSPPISPRRTCCSGRFARAIDNLMLD